MKKNNNTYLYIGAGLLAYFFLIKPKIDAAQDNGDGTETVNSPPIMVPVNQAPAPVAIVATTPVVTIPAGSTIIQTPNQKPVVIPPSVPVVKKDGTPAQIVVSPSGSFIVNTGIPITQQAPNSGMQTGNNHQVSNTAVAPSTYVAPAPTLESSAWEPSKSNQYNMHATYISGLMDDGYLK